MNPNETDWIDLPNLKTITSKGFSFHYIQSVVLISRNIIQYFDQLDIPNLETVDLKIMETQENSSYPFSNVTKSQIESKNSHCCIS